MGSRTGRTRPVSANATGPRPDAQRIRWDQRFSLLHPAAHRRLRQVELPRHQPDGSTTFSDPLYGFSLELVREFPSMSPCHIGLPSRGYSLRKGVHYERTGSLRPHGLRPAQVQDLIHDPLGRFLRVVVGAAPPAHEPLAAEFMISVLPRVRRRSCDPVVSAGLSDGPDILRVLDDSLLLPRLVSGEDTSETPGSLARMRFAAGAARSSATLPNSPVFKGFLAPVGRNRATDRNASCTTARWNCFDQEIGSRIGRTRVPW